MTCLADGAFGIRPSPIGTVSPIRVPPDDVHLSLNKRAGVQGAKSN